MAHQHDVGAGIAATGRGRGADCRAHTIAEAGAGDGLNRDAMAGQEARDLRAHRIDAGLVVAAAIGVHHLAQRGDHGVTLGGEPGDDGGFGLGRGSVVHARQAATALAPREGPAEAPAGRPAYSTRPIFRTAATSLALSSAKKRAKSGASR